MTIDRAKVLLCQMYLPQFDEEEKQALTMAIEALEELKEYKLKEFQCHLAREEGISIGYKNAIDDFSEKLSNECFEQSMTVVFENRVRADVLTLDGVTEIIFDIAEQLKAGGIDGNERTNG